MAIVQHNGCILLYRCIVRSTCHWPLKIPTFRSSFTRRNWKSGGDRPIENPENDSGKQDQQIDWSLKIPMLRSDIRYVSSVTGGASMKGWEMINQVNLNSATYSNEA
ncbi:hypothetical protein EH221_00010 [bacterium]|nr:MAG: hypothetical protein EH221_00010 [bacterium]